MSENVDLHNTQGGPDLDTVRREREPEEAENAGLDDLSGAPFPTEGPDPTGDDPHRPGAPDVSEGVEPNPLDQRDREAVRMQKRDPDGPTYEVDQNPEDHTSGGSTDPNNSTSFSDAGNQSA
jgi:hypothetical protein